MMEESGPHTSIVKVESPSVSKQSVSPDSHSSVGELETCTELSSQQNSAQNSPKTSSIVRKDENNKLTIVTKFSTDSPNTHSASSASSTSGDQSERSRCESSSSGRGTSDDGQSGEHSLVLAANDGRSSMGEPQRDQAGERLVSPMRPESRRHKRKASMFGSQLNLTHKFKSLFVSRGAIKNDESSSEAAATGEIGNANEIQAGLELGQGDEAVKERDQFERRQGESNDESQSDSKQKPSVELQVGDEISKESERATLVCQA